MQLMKYSPLALLVAGLMNASGLAASEWNTVAARATAADGYEVRASQYRIATVPADYFAGLQGGDPRLTLPLPDGKEVTFNLQPYDLLPSDLAARYPGILAFKGYDESNPVETGRFDLGPQGFHAMFSHQGRMVFVDPLRNGDGYAIYYQQDAHSRLEEEADKVIGTQAKALARQVLVDGNERKRYVIAISAAGEYTQYHGGTVEAGLGAIATLLNRVNEVYQRDVAAEFQLASGNDTIIFTDTATDPFNNDDGDIDANVTVQQNAQTQAGTKLGPFDIGHVVNTGGGGLAGLGVLCTAEKSAGMTGSPNPVGDAFFIDYVAHEIGHQFGADHTFNGTTGSCGGGNREASQAWEPGSGSSIMAYAGICGEENLQANSLPYFHSKSIEQMRAHMATVASCGSSQSLTNNAPQVAAGNDYVIPANTPFVLKGAGADLDQDPLSYTWEQIDLGTESFSVASMVDDGSRPLFRFVAPTALSERTLPSLPSLLSNTLAKGEAWPATNRELNFRLTARDGKGGVASDDMKIQVVNTGSAFRLTSPLVTPLGAGANQTIGWDVAGTNAAPINCSKVDLSLTRDEGVSWTLLASGQPNSGSASVTIPAGNDGTARLKVACSDNLFFAISPLKLSVTQRGDEGGGGGGGSLGFWTLALALLGWQRRRA
ncbi:M12 family metallo-peptidase [Aeromonas rivipollensis]|uniref:reprolysin-like metallopeptidase n=1 Tax=Aeromonas rivipollensis TaxID=948519 RepID=UPI00259EA302|nr:zinc-dependent metalloprotease family protein [Aeromonas rivipollensis]MDM5085149.1 M12 family metallo-peptidase [Aeromonas rivipollensis]MDM5097220.1 M12 family metallo-peptidase [Aeromonas rivipollensis]MDM5105519.1 M12 family metallo-peptidase [Aeromonas rivipollensis]